MQESFTLDELELQLVNAIQLNPRASWNLIGGVLGVDPVTAARRWERLTALGLVWTSVYPGTPWEWDLVGANIYVRCAAGKAGAVAEALRADHRVATIEHITGEGDLSLTVFTPNLAELSSYVLTSLGSIRGVRDCRTHVLTAVYTEGSRWRLRTLDAGQRDRILASRPATEPKSGGPLSEVDQRLYAALELDARAGFTELGAAAGVSTSTARRRVNAMLAGGRIVTRCEVAQPVSGWPISASLWCRVRPADLDRVATQVARLPETRSCSSVTGGRANLLLSVWLRSAADIHRLEASLADQVHDLEILDVALSLRHVKRMGRLLDEHGRAVGVVPMVAPETWSADKS
ncbi:Lrp/AsnC family transcriptional regulator [Nocardia sp. NBC_01503]|uniref:Lrp/AsnC family transcriptional regulator n=1 Tax=Nocardia sp. NBC_01503 TaxID=2975997 RepID=UPI002E7B0EA8|nr:Lrp/AsnC family transcriptional regulator [Nocardia sp. NBC_01503]WTL31510.1 Lrp/AsnC family transcriptional regulator [Nocardia sp. NBC_01503]